MKLTGLPARSRVITGNGESVNAEKQFEVFYESTRRPLYGYLFRVLNDRPLAHDLFQETYLRFLNAETEKLDDSAQRAYLFRIAANLINDHFRKHKREQEAMTELITNRPVIVNPGEIEAVQSAMGQLSAQNRSLLWLAYVEQFDHGKIAEVMGMRKGSIKVLLFRARQKMLSLLTSDRNRSKR